MSSSPQRTAGRIAPGFCQHCGAECRDALGSEIWPNRPDLAERVIWVCVTPGCGARVGSHPDGRPLGTAANEELRKARAHVHAILDPIWKRAAGHPAYASSFPPGASQAERKKARAVITQTARHRVYRFLAHRMGLDFDDCHVAMLDLEECRTAWRILKATDYDEIREVVKALPKLESAAKRRKAREVVE